MASGGGGGTQYNTGAVSPTTIVDDNSVGYDTWTNPGNAASHDATYAEANGSLCGSGAYSHRLKATGFGFSIPVTATINGIVVEIEKKASNNDGYFYVRDLTVNLIKSGVVGVTNYADLVTKWNIVEAYTSYGGASDLWGDSWTPAEINSTNFGVGFQANFNDRVCMGTSAYVNHIRMTVYYTN